MDDAKLLTHDLQASAPEVRIALSRAGVRGVSKAIRLRHRDREKLVAADISCWVDLDPLRRETPVTGLETQEMVSLIGIAASSREESRRLVGVEAMGINACPCAQGLVRSSAATRLREAGFDE